MSFDARWRELAARARESADAAAIPDDLARRARSRAPEAIPFVGERTGWTLAAAAIVLSALCLRVVLRADAHAEPVVIAPVPAIPPPPSLPPPPSVEAPEHYVALARTAWRELTP
jgi:hypothetical protein